MNDTGFARFREGDGPPTGADGPGDARSRRTRRRWLRRGEPRPDRSYVLYWMQMYRRARSNAALAEAIEMADRLGLPLAVYEGLDPDYPGACDRHHRFLLGCARETARAFRERGIRYAFRLRRDADDRRPGAAAALAGAAAAVVDDFPAFVLPAATRAAIVGAGDEAPPVLAVDDNGVVPLDEMGKRHYAARTIRPVLHRHLPAWLRPLEEREPERADRDLELPVDGAALDLAEATDAELDGLVADCDVDHGVPASPRYPPGRSAALGRLEDFLESGLAGYADEASDPGRDARSDLSPYLHFGCLSSREVALRVVASDAPEEDLEAFLEQLVVRRELAFNFCRFTPLEDHDSLETLPDWARATMAVHAEDQRPAVYDREVLEGAGTHDELWNTAQRELLHTGTIHGYMRMLWGKKILEWSPDYASALRTMMELHDRYALDGRDPNTYANVLWCFGLHDRAFGERPVFGKLRPMTSESARKKHDVDSYMQRVDRWVERAGGDLVRE